MSFDPTLLRIADLFETPEHVPTVARWIFDEFWADKDGYTVDELKGFLMDARRPDQLPLCWRGRTANPSVRST